MCSFLEKYHAPLYNNTNRCVCQAEKVLFYEIFLIICFDIADGYAFFSRFSAESVLTFCRRDRFRKNVCFTVTECAGCRSPQAVCGHYIGVRTRLGRCVILYNSRTLPRYRKRLRLRISAMTKLKKI